MPTILLVDDDNDVRQVIHDYLTGSGYDVAAFSDTAQATDYLASHPDVNLCLVDMGMPSDVAGGAAFARSLISEKPDMPVILMTGYYTAASRASDLVYSMLFKPFKMDTLVAEIAWQLMGT